VVAEAHAPFAIGQGIVADSDVCKPEPVMIRQRERLDILQDRMSNGMCLSLASRGWNPAPPSRRVIKFPSRPDASVLSATIPLFYIARNGRGLWVAREAEGRSGGLFLSQRGAVHFAKSKSEPAGCATMFFTEPFELDVENQGSRLVADLAATIDVAARRVPRVAAFAGMVIEEWRSLINKLSRAFDSQRRHREAIERELFRGEYTLSSKSDDDLPIVR
jgi:hypothetical protein